MITSKVIDRTDDFHSFVDVTDARIKNEMIICISDGDDVIG